MFSYSRPLLLSACLASLALSACGGNSDDGVAAKAEAQAAIAAQEVAVAKAAKIEEERLEEAAKAEAAEKQAAQARDALQNPDWAEHDNLPPEWGGLYEKNCKIGGPEDTNFFAYRDAKTNTNYEFLYITYPPSLKKRPKAQVIPMKAKVWQNRKNPDHYLLYSTESFSQRLVKDGWTHGLHQTLDGQKWDITAHMMTRYKPTDAVRWGAYLDNPKDYGSTPPCNPKLAQPWAGQVFKTQAGKAYTLQGIMGQ